MTVRVLYISYDGALEPLGQSQVLSYVELLARNADMTLLSFEKPRDLADSKSVQSLRERCIGRGIRWVYLRYHKRPRLLATLTDLVAGIVVGLWLALRRQTRIVHARGYVASVIGLVLQRILGMRFLFDMRGLWADERADAGHFSRESAVYRLAKRFERHFFESADAIVSLTGAGIEAFRDLGYAIRPATVIEIIPTCTDLERFSPGPKDCGLAEQLGLGGGFVIGCVGTMSNRYLRQPMLDYLLYLMCRIDRLEALVVTHEDHAALRRDAISSGVPSERFHVVRAAFSEMPLHIRLMDVGLFFMSPSFANKANAATKLGEFLACGRPVIINEGVGDSSAIVREDRAGVILTDMTVESFEASFAGVRSLLEDKSVEQRCRRTAERWFDLDKGVGKYLRLYDRLLAVKIAKRTNAA